MDRPWKRIIPPTEDSDSWSSVDNDLDINQQWMSINKRARLHAQANMRGENTSREPPNEPENVQNNLDNVLLHHDYAEQSQRRNHSSFRIRQSSPLSPLSIFNNDNMNNDNRASLRYRSVFTPGRASSPVQQRNEFDFLIDTPASSLQSNNHTISSPTTSYDNTPRIRSTLSSLTSYSCGNTDQGTNAVESSTANSSSALNAGFSSPSLVNDHSPRHKRQLDIQKFNFLIALRKFKFPTVPLPGAVQDAAIENSIDEAGSSTDPIPHRLETSSMLPSGSTSQNTSPVHDVSDNITTSNPCNRVSPPLENVAPQAISANTSNPEIIQVPPVERLESLEAVDSVSTITVSTSDVLNSTNLTRNTQAANCNINNLEQTSVTETPEQNQLDLTTAAANDAMEETSEENGQVEVINSEGSVQVLNQGLLSILECPVCWEFISPPIHQCKRGHLVCLPCMQRLHSCPTCRSRFTNLRNLAMEKVADKLRFPCKNSQSGCNETMRLKDKHEHEANCMHRVYRCIVSVCPWNGKHPDLLNHMTTEHHEIVVYGDHKYLYISLDNHATSENWILLAHDVIFRVNFVVNSTQGKIHGCVQYVGPRKLANNYSYTFKAENTSSDLKRAIEYTRTTHNDQSKLNAIYNAGDAFMLMRNTASFFSTSTERHMLVKVSIKKINGDV